MGAEVIDHRPSLTLALDDDLLAGQHVGHPRFRSSPVDMVDFDRPCTGHHGLLERITFLDRGHSDHVETHWQRATQTSGHRHTPLRGPLPRLGDLPGQFEVEELGL